MKTRIESFIQLVTSHNLSYNQELKDVFHKEGKAILKEIAKLMELEEYNVRSNMGGIAVSGEITLHGKNIYVQFSQFGYVGFMYRKCNGLTDYTGERNKWLAWSTLRDLNQVVAELKNTASPSLRVY